jgi:acetyltransferase-like isoleucine patch superfamily enzyme
MLRKLIWSLQRSQILFYRVLLRGRYGKNAVKIDLFARIFQSTQFIACSPIKPSIVIGENTVVRGELFTFGHGGQITIGEYCFVGQGTRIWSAKEIQIGDRVLISHGVNIFDNLTHPLNAKQRHEQFRQIVHAGHPSKLDLDERKVLIQDDALICAGAFVLRGVTIGKGAIVAAGAVVTKDVAAWNVVAGNPAQTIRVLDESER